MKIAEDGGVQVHRLELPPCSKCGREYKPSSCYDYWSVFSFKQPERNMQIAPELVTYYSLCPSCTKEIKNNLHGYHKQKQTSWVDA